MKDESSVPMLPRGWSMALLGDVTEEKVHQAPPSATPVPYIDIGSIDRVTKRIGDTRTIDAKTAPTRARQWVEPGDVLVSMTRPNLNAVAIVPSTLQGAVASTGFDVLRANGTLPEWLFYRTRSDEFVRDVCIGAQGVVYPAVRPHDVRRHRLPVAPLQEQRRIISALDLQFSRLDKAFGILTHIASSIKRYRASVLKAAVEGTLVPTEAEVARKEGRDYEPASVFLERILKERRQRWIESRLAEIRAQGGDSKSRILMQYSEPNRVKLERLPDLPEGWCWSTLDQFLGAIESGKNFRCEERPPAEGQVGVVKVSAVSWGSFDETESKTCSDSQEIDENRLIGTGDFLFSRANTIQLVGACVIVGGISRTLLLSDKILRFRLLGSSDSWILWALRSAFGRTEIEGLATGNQESMRNISQEAIRKIRVPLPPFAEQQRITAEIERQWSQIERLQQTCDRTFCLIARLRLSILKVAFEGQLADQEPTDEPALDPLQRLKNKLAVGKVQTAKALKSRPPRRRSP